MPSPSAHLLPLWGRFDALTERAVVVHEPYEPEKTEQYWNPLGVRQIVRPPAISSHVVDEHHWCGAVGAGGSTRQSVGVALALVSRAEGR